MNKVAILKAQMALSPWYICTGYLPNLPKNKGALRSASGQREIQMPNHQIQLTWHNNKIFQINIDPQQKLYTTLITIQAYISKL